MIPEKLLSMEEVADLFGIPLGTLYMQRNNNKNPGSLGFKVGRYVRFDRRDVEAWIDEQRDQRPLPKAPEHVVEEPESAEPLPANPAEWLARLGRDADDDA